MKEIINGIYLFDDGTLARLLKTNETGRVYQCFSYPYFRLFRKVDCKTHKLLANSPEDLILLLQIELNTPDLSLERWKRDVRSFAQEVLEEVLEDEDDLIDDFQDSTLLKNIRLAALRAIQDCDWLEHPGGQEKVAAYSINYLDVLPEDILRYCNGKNHQWKAVRKATATAHLVLDIQTEVIKLLQSKRRELA